MYRPPFILGFITCLLSLSACVDIPDLGRARVALSEGRIDAARTDLSALAKQHIPEAQFALAELTASSPDPQELQQSIYWYRQAAPTFSRANAQLGKVLIRAQPLGNQSLLEAEQLLYQALENGDQTALPYLAELYLAQPALWPSSKLETLIARGKQQNVSYAYLAEIKLLRANDRYRQQLDYIEKTCSSFLETMSDCWTELLEVHLTRNDHKKQDELLSLARAKFQREELGPEIIDQLARALNKPKYAVPQPKIAKELWTLIAPVYPAAYSKLAKVQLKNPYLGSTEYLISMLEQAIKFNQIEAHLIYGEMLLLGKTLPADPKNAQLHLSKASSSFPKAEYLLGKLYKEGLLGEADPHKAQLHLLNAARRGQPEADLLLASLYSEFKGVKPNLEYAWMFAALAAENGHPAGTELFIALDKKLTDKISRQIAQRNIGIEKKYRLGLFHPATLNAHLTSEITR